MKKKIVLAILTGMMTVSAAGTCLAGEWQWADPNGDGISECYYLENGAAFTNTVTPDGYRVNEAGAWVENGVVQTRPVQAEEDYDHNLSRFQTDSVIWGSQAVDCGDYYRIEYMAYWNYDPESNQEPDEFGIARIRKSAVVHWTYYSHEKKKIVTEDLTLEEYANWNNIRGEKNPLNYVRMWNVIEDEDGYVIEFSDGEAD